MMEQQEVSRPSRVGPYSPGTVGPMLSALNVAVEIGRGLGLVRPTGFVEEMEGLFYRYASSLLAGLLKFVKYGFIGLALCMSSAAVYAVLYQLVMPNKLHERPLYFQYGSSECYSTNSCSAYPETTVDFLHKHNQWQATPLVRTEALGDRVLTAERLYVVDVEFQLPESGVNAHMGNWMVQVDLLTKDDKLLARSVRPLILKYRSRIVRMVYTALMLPWILGGFVSESQNLKVTCFDRFQESGLHPLGKARVSLSSKDLHVYEASLAITPQLNWLQHVMFHWFYTTALLAILFLATVQATVLGLAYLWAQLSIEESQVDGQGMDGPEPILTYTPDANAETGVHYSTSGGQVQGSDELLMGATGQAATRLETEGRGSSSLSSSSLSSSAPAASTVNGPHAPTTHAPPAPSPPISAIPPYVPPQSQQQQLGFRRRAAGQQTGGGRGGGTGAGTQSNHSQEDDELLLS